MLSIKDESLKQVLRLIRKHRTISGAELARITDFQPSTIMYILRKLQKPAIIERAGTGESTGKGGKRPTLWKVTNRRFYIIGIEVLPAKVRYVIVDLNGDVIHRSEENHRLRASADGVSKTIAGLIKGIVTTFRTNEINFGGAGIAFPGLVDSAKGQVLFSSSLDIKNYHMVENIEINMDLPVYISNDANAAALTVPWYNHSNGMNQPESYVYLLYTQGATNLGSGIVIHGRLFEGFSGTAGEIFTPLPALDFWIAKAQAKSLQWKNINLSGKKTYETSLLIEEAMKNCPLSGFVVKKLMHFIADEIIRIVGFLNPEEIVLGGDLTHGNWLIDTYTSPYLKKKANHLQTLGYQMPKIGFSANGKYSVALGATSLVLNKVLS